MTTPPTGRDEMPQWIRNEVAYAQTVRDDQYPAPTCSHLTVRWLAASRDRLQSALEKAERERDEIIESHAELFAERTALREALFFFASVIKSGESWSPACDAAMAQATKPLHEYAVHHIPDIEVGNDG